MKINQQPVLDNARTCLAFSGRTPPPRFSRCFHTSKIYCRWILLLSDSFIFQLNFIPNHKTFSFPSLLKSLNLCHFFATINSAHKPPGISHQGVKDIFVSLGWFTSVNSRDLQRRHTLTVLSNNYREAFIENIS